jgi:hypothetical protein
MFSQPHWIDQIRMVFGSVSAANFACTYDNDICIVAANYAHAVSQEKSKAA